MLVDSAELRVDQRRRLRDVMNMSSADPSVYSCLDHVCECRVVGVYRTADLRLRASSNAVSRAAADGSAPLNPANLLRHNAEGMHLLLLLGGVK
jgi:precorrin-3B methylase